MEDIEYSIIIPVYKNESSINQLFISLNKILLLLKKKTEIIFVNDCSPDKSFEIIYDFLEKLNFPIKIITHSKNLGSFVSIRTGLVEAKGKFFSVMSADLQEPPELIISFFKSLYSNECDVVIGSRSSRKNSDTKFTIFFSSIFWWFYSKIIFRENIPSGGFDVFGCNKIFRDQLILIKETRSSLIGQIFWLGFRRKFINYDRLKRLGNNESGWSFIKKLDYAFDSFFSFSSLPIVAIIILGFLSFLFLILLLFFLVFYKGINNLTTNYFMFSLIIITFNVINIISTGMIGVYVWRTYENTKRRPISIVATKYQNKKYEI
jgi:glycosyltransferase involved in cell wall biosynthesis